MSASATLAGLGVHLAPYAVVRAARWSVDSLLTLVPPPGSVPASESHPDRLRRELAPLWHHTLGDEAFRKALAVSDPALYGRLRQVPCPVVWNKAARQLTATLYRQWAEACWRTEPAGLWAGVGLTSLQARRPARATDTHAAVGRVAVAPHLQPFATLLAALAGTEPYLQRGRFKVHPSALRQAPGVWLVRGALCAGDDGLSAAPRTRRLRLRHIDPAAADRCITALMAQGPLPYTALLRVATRLLRSPDTAQALVDQLLAAQLLIGGLALPPAFETAWHALDRAALELLPLHRAPWQATVTLLRACCQQLEQQHAELSAEAVWQLGNEAADGVAALAPQLGVASVALPRACLQWDAGLPAPLLLDTVALERLQRTLAVHERFHRQADPRVALDTLCARSQDQGRQLAMRQLLASEPDWDRLAHTLQAQGDDAGLTARLQALRQPGRPTLETPPPTALAPTTAAAPFGGLMLRLGRDSTLVQGLSHEPWLAYARFGALLGRHAPRAHPLHAWCDTALTQFAQSCNVSLAQVRVACAPLPNWLAQPRFSVARALDPYGTTPGAWPDAGLQLCHDGQRRWLQSPTTARPMVALCATALDVGAHDPLLERVLLTGWRYRPPAAAVLSNDLATTVGQPHRLAADVLRQRARWRLDGESARALVKAEPAARWALWQALAQRCGWPALITVANAGQPAVLMPRDSALAVEVLFCTPSVDSPVFEIEAPEDECLITDPKGDRHATEVVLVFARDQHAWNVQRHPVAPYSTEPGRAEAEEARSRLALGHCPPKPAGQPAASHRLLLQAANAFFQRRMAGHQREETAGA
ncbi:MAG: hypothetical protein V4739_06595 [Pseudomonadota bacterium]